MSEPQATVLGRRRIPGIWLVPIVAVLLGVWMVVYTAMTEGPEIEIVFATAEGIEAGKTKIKSRSVALGVVESVALNDNLESVTVVARLDRGATRLLRDDTRFWVVRPRFGTAGISGLGTIMSGAYIELEPGSGAPSRKREFAGLDDVPVTAGGTPGLQLVLVASRAGSLGVGDPVLYRGYQVGKVEGSVFVPETRQVRHRIFIAAPYDTLVSEATRFWNASGLSLEATASGVRLDVGSLQSLLAGGVAFGLPEGQTAGAAVENGAEFTLYNSYKSTREQVYQHHVDYVVSFSQSIRGLSTGAPVEYRGVRVGHVGEILLADLARIATTRSSDSPIPVRIRLEPGRMQLGDNPEGVVAMRQVIRRAVAAGLQGRLQSGNLLTGSLFISFDFNRDDPPGTIGTYEGYPTLPTQTGGLQRIERQVGTVLAKLSELPLETTVRELNKTLAKVSEVAGSEQVAAIPASFNRTLEDLQTALASLQPDSPLYDRLDRAVTELNRILQSVEKLSRTLGDQPSSVLFSDPSQPDPEPRGKQ